MRRCVVVFLTLLSSCYRYPGYRCIDDVYYSHPLRERQHVRIPRPSFPSYHNPLYSEYYYYAPPRVNVIQYPSPLLPPQPRKVEQKGTPHTKSNAPVRSFKPQN